MSTPAEIKAQAIALLTLGHPCRQVEKELHRRFPSAKIPHFTTIARWVRETPPNKGRAALARWWFVLERAGELVGERLKTDQLTPGDLVQIAAKAGDIQLALARSVR